MPRRLAGLAVCRFCEKLLERLLETNISHLNDLIRSALRASWDFFMDIMDLWRIFVFQKGWGRRLEG
jgi:hypothetical protein